MYSVIEMLTKEIETDLPKSLGKTDEEVIPVIVHLAELFGLKHLQEFMHVFYENGYFQLTRGKLINSQILDLYKSIRPHVAKLVDAWDFHDLELATPFGKFDGEIYEKYFQVVNELPQDIVPEYWKDYLDLDFS